MYRTFHSVCVSHFRNGCKKTGVYCCAAYVIEKLKEEQEVDVFTSVRQIRLSRPQFIIDVVSARASKWPHAASYTVHECSRFYVF